MRADESQMSDEWMIRYLSWCCQHALYCSTCRALLIKISVIPHVPGCSRRPEHVYIVPANYDSAAWSVEARRIRQHLHAPPILPRLAVCDRPSANLLSNERRVRNCLEDQCIGAVRPDRSASEIRNLVPPDADWCVGELS